MNNATIKKLAGLLRENGDKILSSEFKLKLSVSLLSTLNEFFLQYPSTDSESENGEGFQILKGNNTNQEIQLIHDFIQKTVNLSLSNFPNDPQDAIINISKFKNLRCLEIHKVSVKKIQGIQPLRTQLEQIKCTQCLVSIKEIIIDCGADNSSSFSWNNLSKIDLSFNNLTRIDNSFEFLQSLRYLNISHNKLSNADVLNVLPNLIVVDLSFNRLTRVPYFHVDAIAKIEFINLDHNLIESLIGFSKLDSLSHLNMGNNCFIDHKDIDSLSILPSLRYLNFLGNPISFHPRHRDLTSSNLHINGANERFILNGLELSKKEKSNCGKIMLSSYHHTTSKSISEKSFTNSANNICSSDNSKPQVKAKFRKKRFSRLIDIDKDDNTLNSETDISSSDVTLMDDDHLKTKKHIESLREQYGAKWLIRSDNGQIREEGSSNIDSLIEQEDLESMNDIVSDIAENSAFLSSTPKNDSLKSASNISECSVVENQILADNQEQHEFILLDEIYKDVIIDDRNVEPTQDVDNVSEKAIDYKVFSRNYHQDIFISVSDDFIKERDILSGSTISKWSVAILESCDRLKSNTLRINFYTLRKDLQERIYSFESENNCSDLEKYLRNMLSDRSLCEMNQKIYKCLNCSCQFSFENKIGENSKGICCPECKSIFLCEQKDFSEISKSNNVNCPHDSDVEVLTNSNSSRSSSVEVLNEDKNQCTANDEVATEASELDKNSIFDTIIQSTNKLMSKTSDDDVKNIESNLAKYKFNYVDFSDVDHRLKFYFYQTMFQDNNEQFKCIVKSKLYIESKNKFVESGVLVISTCKLYLMQIFSLEYAEDIAKWMRTLQIIPLENIGIVEMLPYSVGLRFNLKSFGNILLLLQDSLRCESLIFFLGQRKELPPECRLYREECQDKLTNGIDKSTIKMLTIVNNITVITDSSTNNYDATALFLTDDKISLTDPTTNLLWLIPRSDYNITSSFTSQNLNNLIEIKNLSDNRILLCFLEETLNNLEVWDCMFETKGSMEYCLQKIDYSWSSIFGVSLLKN